MWLALILVFLLSQSAKSEERLLQQNLPSRFLPAQRRIQIYLPASYATATDRRYPVLYLHDGQNLFSSAGTNICFGWGNWQLDKTVDELCRTGRMQELILVAVDNSPTRYAEYCGRHHLANTTTNTEFENYAAFLIQELKPWTDSHLRTRPQPEHTGLMGSSMGGICSLILAWENPAVFGRSASLSGAFQVEGTNFLNEVLSQYRGKPRAIRFYLDSGEIDFTGGDDGRNLTAAVYEQLKRIGWNHDLMLFLDEKPLSPSELIDTDLRRDKWNEAQTSQHNEFYWRRRAWRPLTFLFPVEQK